MKRFLSIILLAVLLVSLCSMPALADEEKEYSATREYKSRSFTRGYNDYSVEGWYYVDTITPASNTYSYIYNRPSSTSGDNLGRVNDGEQVYVYYATSDAGGKIWGYCAYYGVGRAIKGYIRYENLATEPGGNHYYSYNYNGYNGGSTYSSGLGWYIVDTVSPQNKTYSYMYDQPSSINGNNLGRVNDGERVYVYRYSDNGKWVYCRYDGIGRTITGYIHAENVRKSW